MSEFKRIAIDTSKSVFTLHGVGADERPLLRKTLSRSALLPFLSRLAPTEIALEACGSAHHWARQVQALGHAPRLIPPQYVKPFVKRGKNDRNDAEAISEAASRPGMRSVPVKTTERQAQTCTLGVRDLLVRQRTQLVNALRGHAAEFGAVAPRSVAGLATLKTALRDTDLPAEARETFDFLIRQIERLDQEIKILDARLTAQHKANPVTRMLAGIPGIGPIGALTLAARVDPAQFASGRHLAAWIGLTPQEHSTGGRQQMGGISRAGDERLRQLLVLGATSVIRHVVARQAAAAAGKSVPPGPLGAALEAWLVSLLERRPRKLCAVALANKMARIAWAMMTSGEQYRRRTAAA
ncbi:IS110 family RNA-guided transposase [Gluconacetobacter tumulicola]|uniref:IS110 family transposase n=1 Tax=Gluconacetobacter tumulicola TaxID=1017177 RepID=A0A7W4P8R8_9PROT|nr:IS110 family transposase [Gluconacetobacter tumulicola]MBB2181259.1 IS110 family transposase [Gluconacetobacter tumulicola]